MSSDPRTQKQAFGVDGVRTAPIWKETGRHKKLPGAKAPGRGGMGRFASLVQRNGEDQPTDAGVSSARLAEEMEVRAA